MCTKLCDVTIAKEGLEVDVEVTVEKKFEMRSWGKGGGTKISCILRDDKGKCDFIAWGVESKKISEEISEGKSYLFKSLKVNKCSPAYSRASSGIQLTYTVKSDHVIINKTFGYPDVQVCKVSGLCADNKVKQCFAGVITKICDPTDVNGTKRTDVVVQDETGKIVLSYWGDRIGEFGGSVGDVILIENCIVKQIGAYCVVSASSATVTIHPENGNLRYLYHLNVNTENIVDRSPNKTEVSEILHLSGLTERSVKQSVKAKIVGLTFGLYEQCPYVSCKKTLKKLDGGLYNCVKCQRLYKASATGIRLALDVSDEECTKTFVIFNEKAESLLHRKCRLIEENELTAGELLETVYGKEYSFVVVGGRNENEFLCLDFTPVFRDVFDTRPVIQSSESAHRVREQTVLPVSPVAYARIPTIDSIDKQSPRRLDFEYVQDETISNVAKERPVIPVESPLCGGNQRSATVTCSSSVSGSSSQQVGEQHFDNVEDEVPFSAVFEHLGNLLSQNPPSPYASLDTSSFSSTRKRKRSYDIMSILDRD